MMENNNVNIDMGSLTPRKDEGDDEASHKTSPGDHYCDDGKSALLTTLRKKLRGIKDGHKEQAAQLESGKELEQKTKLKIRKAPESLCNKEEMKKLLKPKVLFLGPIYHNKDESSESEKIKRRLAYAFLEVYKLEEVSACSRILEKIKEIKDLYDEVMLKGYNDVDLSVMLFFDGCALLYYITCFMRDGLGKELIKDYPAQLVNTDLFLLENQLPYYVLELLSEGSELKGKLGEIIDNFVRLQWSSDYARQTEAGMKDWDATHLLEHLWVRITALTVPNAVLREGSTKSMHSHKDSAPSTIAHSATALKEVRVHFRPRKSIRLQDIAFTSQCVSGYLEIPPLSIDDSTAGKLANLIAMEKCEDFTSDPVVSTYVWFLQSLISDYKDVSELRLAKVLSSFLPTDAEIFQLLKLVASNLSPKYSIYSKVNSDIQGYFDNTRKITFASWLAEAAQEYFKTPFRTVAVVFAGLTILLTMIQSYYSVFPRNCS